jgi:beta-N-acetylglucosaminidase
MALQKQTYDYSILSSGWISRRSLIQINKSSATSTWASQYILNLNTNNDGGGCDSTACWYAASEEAVGTYMDPRNFLNPNYIFMFESNEYDSSVQNIEGLNKILAGSFMDSSSNYYSAYALENNALYGDTLMSAAVQSGISPYVLAARIKQEIGINGSSIISGTVPNYLNLYNYYNISASGNNPVVNGLIFAANSGWNTRINAIIGGAQFIGENYKGTEYTQKWDVIGNDYVNYSDFFNKQYMQNIQAPANQTTTIYNAYLSNNNLSFPFVFSIPVYKNMPNSQTTISAAIINANYSYSDSYIGDVKNGSTVNTIKYNLKIAGENISVSVKGKDGVTDLNDSSRIGTGDILIISDGVNTETLRIVIYGDTNGDGNISAVDYVNIKNNIMGSTSLNGYYKIASDVNKDGNISAVDYVNIKNYIMGVASLIK